jgi:hypothetical protein
MGHTPDLSTAPGGVQECIKPAPGGLIAAFGVTIWNVRVSGGLATLNRQWHASVLFEDRDGLNRNAVDAAIN